MTMTTLIKDSLPVFAEYLPPEDIKNLSDTNHEMRLFSTDPRTAPRIWQPLVPNFPNSLIVCQTRADIIQRESNYFARTIDFISLNERCVARLTFSQIEPNSLVLAPTSGQIVNVSVKENMPIIISTPLFLISGMKMELLVRAAIAGTLKKLFVTNQNNVTAGQLLAWIK